jgi:hypothetical protein
MLLASTLAFPQAALAHAPVASPLRHLKLRNLGPAIAGGRVTSVVGIPGQPEIYYVGSAAGGVWKTTNNGASWKNVFSHGDTASIGAVTLAPSNPNLVWVGTGEANPRNDMINGGGVYYSPDAGKNWRFMGLRQAGQISQIVVDPVNPKIVFVCALGNVWKPTPMRGVYRSSNGGKTWQRVLFVNNQTGCSTLAMQPGNPEVLIAGLWQLRRYPWKLVSGGPSSGLYRSLDGGLHWQKLTHGLPKGLTGRSDVAFAPSRPDKVYAVIQAKHGVLWSSNDMGLHWHLVSNNQNADVRPFYFTQVAVSPKNPDQIFLLSMKLMESKNGGRTLFYADKMVHVDHHAIWIDPKNGNRIIQGNDGGVYLSHNDGKNWRYLDNLPIEEFYQVAVNDHVTPFLVCGGIQDNNAWCGPSSDYSRAGVNGLDWFMPVGGDGEYVVPAPTDPNIVYASSENGYTVRYNVRTTFAPFIEPYYHSQAGHKVSALKYRFNWTAPIAVSYRDPNEVYTGANVLFRSRDGGLHWKVISPDLTRNDKAKEGLTGGPVNYDISGAENYDTIESISIARTNPQVLWVGTDDGLVWVTRNGGRNWQKVTPPDAPAWARVYQIGVSPFNAGSAYLSFDAHELGNNRPYVYHTDNYGHSWHPIDRGLPDDSSVLVVREDPNDRGFLVAGTMTGVYYSHDRGGRWHRLTANLPTMPVWDLKFVHHPDSLVLASHGRGLWVLDNLKPLEGLTRAIAQKPFALFPMQKGTLFYTTDIGDPAPPFYSAPNAPVGVTIAYYLQKTYHRTKAEKKAHATPVKIRIETRSGSLVDTLYGSAHSGVESKVWPLVYQGPQKMDFGHYWMSHGPHGFTGPSVAPGTYRVVVSVGHHQATGLAQVVADPRFHISQAQYVAQRNAGLELSAMITAMDTLLDRIHGMQNALRTFRLSLAREPALQGRYGAVLRAGHRLDQKLVTLLTSVYNPERQHNVSEASLRNLVRLHQKIINTYTLVIGNYAQPINHRIQRMMAHRRSELEAALARFNGLLKTSVSRYNHLAYATDAPTLFPGSPIRIQPTPP